MPEPVAVAAGPAARVSVARSRPRVYVGLSLFMVAIVIVGFWPTYFGPMLRGNIARPPIIQWHGIVFVGWMALLVAQVLLAARGRLQAHRRLGRFGIAYGVLVLVMGLAAGIAAPVRHVAAGDWTEDRGAGFLLITLGDMTLFGALFAAAVVYRRRPEIHKRLMMAATVALLFAAVGRMDFITSQAVYLFVWLSPMFIGMVYDWRMRGRVHPAYLTGTAVLFAGASRVLFERSEGWLRAGRAILAAFS